MMDREPKIHRIARHWYDVDCLLTQSFATPFTSWQAIKDVIEVKKQRWAEKGVSYEAIFDSELKLIPTDSLLARIEEDHHASIKARMFYGQPDSLPEIVERLRLKEQEINHRMLLEVSVRENLRWAKSGAWMQAVVEQNTRTLRSEMTLLCEPEQAIKSLVDVCLASNNSLTT